MTKEQLVELAKTTARANQLDPALVCAVCEQESGWEPYAIRYEPAFYDRYIVPLKLPSSTDSHARSFSWGLMQVMGQVAIENGFKARFLSSICDPYVGLDIGCKVLSGKLKRANGDITQGLLYWNGGGAPNYPIEVMARMEKYK